MDGHTFALIGTSPSVRAYGRTGFVNPLNPLRSSIIRMRSNAKICEPEGVTARVPVRDARGFILPLTLWMIAIIGLLAATMNAWVAQAVANAQSLTDRTQLELTQANLRNELVYLMAVRPVSYRGLEVGPRIGEGKIDFNAVLAGPSDTGRTLRFDGRPYVAESDPNIILTIQDGSGLLNLNTASAVNLKRALATFEIPEPEVNRLVDTLQDYIDEDDLTRLAGAEKTQYDRLNMPLPANGLLLSPFEAQKILGWDRLGALWEADTREPFVTTCRNTGFNVNTAPAPVLSAVVRGMTQDKAQQVLARRVERPFRNVRELSAAADLLITDEPFFYTFNSSNCVVVDMIDKRSAQHVRFSLTLEQSSTARPWRVDYAVRIPSQYRAALDRIDPEAVFPTPESVDSPAQPAERGNTGAVGNQ